MMLTMCVETDLHHADASAAVSHVAQREISRESRHRQTESYSYSSNRSACTSHHVVPPGRMCRRSHPSFNACFESMMLLMHVASVKRCEPRKLCVVHSAESEITSLSYSDVCYTRINCSNSSRDCCSKLIPSSRKRYD